VREDILKNSDGNTGHHTEIRTQLLPNKNPECWNIYREVSTLLVCHRSIVSPHLSSYFIPFANIIQNPRNWLTDVSKERPFQLHSLAYKCQCFDTVIVLVAELNQKADCKIDYLQYAIDIYNLYFALQIATIIRFILLVPKETSHNENTIEHPFNALPSWINKHLLHEPTLDEEIRLIQSCIKPVWPWMNIVQLPISNWGR
jgi:hypothetical protein